MNKEFEKIKVESAEIVVHGTSKKPYYEIRYYDISDGKYHIGYSSYDLSIVFGWLKECFEIVQEVAEEYTSTEHINCSTNTSTDGWIPIKTRPMTDEEKEYYSEYLFEDNGFIYECLLPNDGQEVLITSKYGSVDKTTFYTDCGNYFENYEDYDEVIAWQPLPECWKGENNG